MTRTWMKQDHEIVRTELADLLQQGLRARPRVLVVENHCLAQQGFELRNPMMAIDDLVVCARWIVRVVGG